MANGAITHAGHANVTAARRRGLACILIAALAPLMGHAPTLAGTTRTTVMRSGLHSFSPEHSPFVTVSETGALGSSAQVTIEFRDDADTLVAVTTGELGRGKPVRLLTPVHGGSRLVQLRTIVTIKTLVDGGSSPVAVFEDVGPGSLIARIIVCGPVARVGGGQYYCPGWSLAARED
jgi:hypothetical protein